jgi:transposase InsO family protein
MSVIVASKVGAAAQRDSSTSRTAEISVEITPGTPTATSPRPRDGGRAHPGWGPRTIAYQLARKGSDPLPGRSSIYRCLVRHRLVEPGVRKRRRQDYKRWERSSAMELWQMDLVGRIFLADGTECHALTGIDDHSRYCVSAHLMARATARPVCGALRLALERHGLAKAILTDNGKVFTARFGRGPGPVLFDRICHDNGLRHLLTAPYSPTTTGKVERFHKTMRAEFLVEHDRRHATLDEAQAALDAWVASYNTERPHQGAGMRPPSERFALRPVDEPELVEPELVEPEEDEPTVAPRIAPVTRRVDQAGKIHLERFAYGVGRWLAGEVVEVRLSDGLVEISHRGVVVATRARHHGADPSRTITNERAAWRASPVRPPTVGASVLRFVGSTGSISFAGWNYRVGNPFRGRQVEVAIVGKTLQISLDGAVVKRHPIRHDRTKEFGAFSTPTGRPRNRRPA